MQQCHQRQLSWQLNAYQCAECTRLCTPALHLWWHFPELVILRTASLESMAFGITPLCMCWCNMVPQLCVCLQVFCWVLARLGGCTRCARIKGGKTERGGEGEMRKEGGKSQSIKEQTSLHSGKEVYRGGKSRTDKGGRDGYISLCRGKRLAGRLSPSAQDGTTPQAPTTHNALKVHAQVTQ